MANYGCIDGTLDLDTAKYASPMPVIGSYIAAASLICMLFMLYDIVAGFRARERWIPCKLFTLNSVTLTLLSVASKIPFDLTTAMPSPQDQLSKLSGTVFICISMAFLLPSVGVNSETDCFPNVVAMTILIITVVVNICLQLSTGVIILFRSQHIFILCCMLILLIVLWVFAWDINNRKKILTDQNKEIFTIGKGSMFQRLKKSFLFGYCSSPQLLLCRDQISAIGGLICPICSFILIDATHKFHLLKQSKMCSGTSDYDWSISPIVVTQVLTVILGTSAILFRWLALSKHMDHIYMGDSVDEEADYVIDRNPILGIGSRLQKFKKFTRSVFIFIGESVRLVAIMVPGCLISSFWIIVDEYFVTRSDEWVKRKSNKELNTWLDAGKNGRLEHFVQLLSRARPSLQLCGMEIKDESHPDQPCVEVSCLSVVLLVRIAHLALPNNLSGCLAETFREVVGIIHFIDKTINPKSLKNRNKLRYAEAVWAGEDFSCLLASVFDTSSTYDQPQSQLERAVLVVTKLKNTLPSDPVWDELGIVVDFICRKEYTSIEDFATSVEQMFVDMLHLLLAQLPSAVVKFLSESPAQEYHGRVKHALILLRQVDSIKHQIQWSFPEGCSISRLICEEASNTSKDDNVPVRSDGGPVPGNVNINMSTCTDDVVIQVQG